MKEKEEQLNLLTEVETVQVSVILEKLVGLKTQTSQVERAFSGLITSIVESKGLDPKHYGVNLKEGKVLPLESA